MYVPLAVENKTGQKLESGLRKEFEVLYRHVDTSLWQEKETNRRYLEKQCSNRIAKARELDGFKAVATATNI